MVWLLKKHAGQKLFGLAIACVLGGAVGNVIDRVLYGYVVDFLDFHYAGIHFPAFNLADSAITLSELNVTGKIPGITAEKFQECAENAKENCPISKLYNCEKKLTATLA